MSDDPYSYRQDARAFGELCCKKYAEEFAAFRKERHIRDAQAVCDKLASELAAAQRALLEELSK